MNVEMLRRRTVKRKGWGPPLFGFQGPLI